MAPPPDRIEELQAQNGVTGIDFVYVHSSQVTLDVFFLRDPATLAAPLIGTIAANQVRIRSTSGGPVPEVPVTGTAWTVSDGRDVLRLTTAFPGGFTLYRLAIADARIDDYYNDVVFSFKAACPTEFDCKPGPHVCAPDAVVDFPVNYLARDFWSFRRALLDFASERYPEWQDRLEADAGVMLAEVMSAMGDELAYNQDRIAREAYLESASERRSLRRHARLVDYQISDGRGATTWVDLTMQAGAAVNIPGGTQVWALEPLVAGKPAADRRAASRVVFEVGRGLVDRGVLFNVDAARNSFAAHLFDEDDLCLPAGSTVLHIDGAHAADLPFDDFTDPLQPGKWVLLRTAPADPSIPVRVWPVKLIDVVDTVDPVLPGTPAITRLVWAESRKTPFEMDLTTLSVRGNLLRATAGETRTELFMIGPRLLPADPVETVERTGANNSVTHLFSLPGSDRSGVVWHGANAETRRPEIRLFESGGPEWTWRRALIGVNSAQAEDRDFTLDDGVWRRVVGYRRIGREIVHIDYATGQGTTVRFGDGEFAMIPATGTHFEVVYRLGNGRVGDVAADVLVDFDHAALPLVAAITNPLPAIDGIDPESPFEVRQSAPEAFRAITFRAVRPEDYSEAVERLPWVQRAGTAFRWTGGWITAFTTPDPRSAAALIDPQRTELFEQLDRFRQAGREAWGLDPIYADLDLEIRVCVEPTAFSGDVKERVLEALFGRYAIPRRLGFFAPDHFTFGTPLWRSELEATIQDVPGVRAVRGIRVRRRGRTAWQAFTSLVLRVADNEVVRVQNDRLLPERGSVRLRMEGGA